MRRDNWWLRKVCVIRVPHIIQQDHSQTQILFDHAYLWMGWGPSGWKHIPFRSTKSDWVPLESWWLCEVCVLLLLCVARRATKTIGRANELCTRARTAPAITQAELKMGEAGSNEGDVQSARAQPVHTTLRTPQLHISWLRVVGRMRFDEN